MKWSLVASALLFFLLIIGESCQNEPFPQGKYIYEAQCSNCHLDNGLGLGKEIPSLRKSTTSPAYWSCIIRNGRINIIEQDGVRYKRQMPANPNLSAPDISNVINYIQSKWVDESKFVGLDSINIWLEECE